MVGRQIPKGRDRARDGRPFHAPAPPSPHDDIRAVASAVGNASFARMAAGTQRRAPADRQLQRTLVMVVGEDHPGEATITASASLIAEEYDDNRHEVEPLERVRKAPETLRTPAPDEDIYLVAHGDDPGHPEVTSPNLGDFGAAGIVKLLERVLKPLKEQYTGTIYLSGCHTAARLYGEEGVRGGSLLDEVTLLLQDSKWAKRRLAPEVQIVGYPGSLFDKSGTAGRVAIESPYERAEYRRRGGRGKKSDKAGGAIGATAEDSWVRRRWGQKPDYLTNKPPKKRR